MRCLVRTWSSLCTLSKVWNSVVHVLSNSAFFVFDVLENRRVLSTRKKEIVKSYFYMCENGSVSSSKVDCSICMLYYIVLLYHEGWSVNLSFGMIDVIDEIDGQ